tara:strand:+ start:33 stop:395 length:363 start_codon:yes stop_codon:yes gene_type:complete
MNTKTAKSNHYPTADQLQQKAQEKAQKYPTSQLKCYRERIEKAEKKLQEFSNMTNFLRATFKLSSKLFKGDTDEEVIDYYTGVINENKNNIKLFLIVMNKEKVKKIEDNLMKTATGIFSC